MPASWARQYLSKRGMQEVTCLIESVPTTSIDFLALLSILRGMSVYLSLSTAQATAQAEGQKAEEQQATASNSNRQQARQSDITSRTWRELDKCEEDGKAAK
jgi:hypothetical protein